MNHPQASSSGSNLHVWAVVLTVLGVLTYSGIWVWPAIGWESSLEESIATPAALDILRKLFFLTFVGLFLAHVHKRGLNSILRVVAPFLPFLVAGMVSAAAGYDLASARYLLFNWMIMMLASAICTSEMAPPSLSRTLMWSFLAALSGSVLLALLSPDIGTQLYGGERVWRGMFVGKNLFGWVCAIAFLVGLFPPHPSVPPAVRWSVVGLALVCLVFSGSSTSLISSLGTAGLWIGLRTLSRRLTSGTAMLSMVILVVLVAALFVINLPILEDLMGRIGRDLTFTGRTRIWSVYLADMMRDPVLGAGPGAYTTASQYTIPLAQQLARFGNILTPHNTFLACLGEVGIVGLVAFVGAFGWMLTQALNSPHVSPVGPLVLLQFLGGMTETRDVFGSGPAIFLLVLCWGALLAQSQPDTEGWEEERREPSFRT